MAFSALSRMAAMGFRISCATPAATRPIAASRSPVATCRADLIGAAAGLGKPPSRVVQRHHDAIEFALACRG